MKYQLQKVSSTFQVESIFSKMDLLYGTQSHLLSQLVLLASNHFPGLVNIALDEQNEQRGHIVFIPFNEAGKQKILSPKMSESELNLEDLFDVNRDDKAYVFVYSIYSQNYHMTKALIQKTIISLQENELNLGSSEIFTEVVSKEGRLLANKLSLYKSYEYSYENELIHIYDSSLNDFMKSF